MIRSLFSLLMLVALSSLCLAASNRHEQLNIGADTQTTCQIVTVNMEMTLPIVEQIAFPETPTTHVLAVYPAPASLEVDCASRVDAYLSAKVTHSQMRELLFEWNDTTLEQVKT